MAKIQMDIPDNINKQLRIYTIKKDYGNKRVAIIEILKEHLKKELQGGKN